MAALPDEDRRRTWAHLMRELSDNVTLQGIAISKADLRAALNAVDDWVDENSTSFNQALPQPARSGLTMRQKVVLLSFVILRRAGLLRAKEDDDGER
jgi:hypothetical protein